MKKKLLGLLLVVCSLFYVSHRAEWARASLRSKVSDAVVMLTNAEGNSGGTGFTVKAASGTTYILTNDHVCALAGDDKVLYAKENDSLIPLKVIYQSIYTDLCLVSPLAFKSPLKLARSYDWGQQVAVVGHPMLYANTMTEGELVQGMKIMVFDHIITDGAPCSKYPKYKAIDMDLLFFKLPVCVLDVKAVMTTVPILPGSSGSPVTNLNGDVVGIAFAASDKELGRAYIIPLEDIQLFLSNY